MRRTGGFLAAALLAAAINMSVSLPAAAAGSAPPVMKGGHGGTNTSSPDAISAPPAIARASTVASGTPTPHEAWTTQNPSPDANSIFAIACPSTTECVAVGLDGILVTTNSGSTWSTTSTQGNLLTAVSCLDPGHCAAVGYNGMAFSTASANGANTWSSTQIVPNVIFYGVSCSSLTQCMVVGQGTTIYKINPAGGGPVSLASNVTGDLFAVSCASDSMCAAVGAGGEITTYNGTSWSAQVASSTAPALYGVSCPTTMVCLAVGQGGTVDETSSAPGGGWSPGGVGNSNVALSSISCTTSACYIAGVDGDVYVRAPLTSGTNTSHGGTGASGALFGVSCPSSTACYAAGDGGIVVSTTNGGNGWTQQTGAAAFAIHSASCPTTTVCFTVGNGGEIQTSANGGSTWTLQTSNTTQELDSIACTSTTNCYAVGLNGTIDHYNGTSWATQASPVASNLLSVSCADATHCFVLTWTGGSNAEVILTVNGSTWTGPNTISTGANTATAISCPSTSTCFATLNTPTAHPQVWESTNSGATWSLSFDMTTDPDSGFQNNMTIRAIACASTTTCKAVGSQGMILATSDGGANWRSESPPESLNFTGVACPSTSTCFASADDKTVAVTANSGATWTVLFTGQPSQNAYNDVACGSTSMCLAVGDAGTVATTTAGSAVQWTKVRPTGFSGSLGGMSCFGSADCYAVGLTDILSTHNSGSTWSDTTLGTTETDIAVSCPAANTCYAVGWPGAIDKSTDGGATWPAQTNPFKGADRTLIGVSCADLTHCVAVGTDGIALSTSDGTTWSPEVTGTSAAIFKISCPTTSLCVAIGASSSIYTRSGATWTARSSGTTNSLRGVTCVTSTTCYIVGRSGTILVSTNSGVSWMPQVSGITQDLNSISCAQASYCVAGGNLGTALVTVDGGTWNALNPPTVNTIRAVAFPDLNHVWLAGDGGMILADTSIFPSCRSVAIAPSKSSPQPVGTSLNLNATASGCPDGSPSFRFWLRNPAGTWNIVQDWSTSTSFSWDTSTYAPGTYLIGVWVKDSNSSFTYDAYAFGTFTIEEPPCTFVSVSSDVGSPQNVGTTVHFMATLGGCPLPQYQWWVRDAAGNWSIAVPFATGTSSFTWNTSSLSEGTYQIGIWVKEAHSSASYEAFAFITYTLTVATAHCSVPNLVPAPTSPQPTGTSITFAASATGCSNAQFRYWIRDLGGTWHIVQDWTATTTYTWNNLSTVPNTAAGTYLVGIWARAVGSTNSYDDFFFLTFTLTSGPTCAVNISPAPGSGATTGTPVTWTATPTAACTASPKYRFWVNPPGGAWTIKQDYSTTATFNWVPNAPGTYQVGVWILQAGSVATYDNFAFTTFSVTSATPPTPCTDVEVGTVPASPQLANTGSVTLTATAHGCPSPQYRWWVRDLGANWSIVQDYPGTNTFMWNTNIAAGTYLLGVWVRNSGSAASYEAYSFITFTLTPNPPPQVCSSVNISPDVASPQAPGTIITFTATANGCNAAQYEFFVQPPGGSFAVAQGWGGSNTFIWNTAGLSPGPWAIGVWARQNSSGATYESFAFITYQLQQ